MLLLLDLFRSGERMVLRITQKVRVPREVVLKLQLQSKIRCEQNGWVVIITVVIGLNFIKVLLLSDGTVGTRLSKLTVFHCIVLRKTFLLVHHNCALRHNSLTKIHLSYQL